MLKQNLTITKRDDTIISFTFKDDNGNPIDITGFIIFLTVKTDPEAQDADDTNAVIKETVSSHTDPTNGLSEMSISKTDSDVTEDIYFYDLQFRDSGGNITTFLHGEFEVRQDVTVRIA